MASTRGRRRALRDGFVPGEKALRPPVEPDYLAPLPWSDPDPALLAQAARPRKDAQQGPYLALFVISLIAILAMGLFVFRSYSASAAFEHRREKLQQDQFFDGIYVDGIALAGLDRQEALSRVRASGATRDAALDIVISVGDRQYHVGPNELPFDRDIALVLDRAYAIGRQGFPWMLGSDKTPFEVRWEHILHAAHNQAQFSTTSSYDRQTLRGIVDQIASQVDRAPKDAMVETFDFNTKRFTVTKDEPGYELDRDALFQRLSESLDQGRLSDSLSVSPAVILPKLTSVELLNSFTLLSSFSTEATRDRLRNTNIALAARAIHGQAVMPGETFSFNKTVGPRTTDKGYQMAPAIAGGISFDEIGGGVCQVSSTLFNAAALADMQIVARSPHAWPSSYVAQGRDATVNWPNLDFVFKNTKPAPVYIVADFRDRQMMVEIYGLREAAGESIELRTELVRTTPPPSEAIYQLNPTLPPGSEKVLKKARTGYLVDTYRVYLRGGVPYREEKLCTSDYRMVQQVIEYN